MSDPKQLSQDLEIASGDVVFQLSSKGDYQDQAHFVATMQPMFDAAARANAVAFSDLLVDTVSLASLDGAVRDLYRATATAGPR